MGRIWLILLFLQIALVACSNSERVASEDISSDTNLIDSTAIIDSLVENDSLEEIRVKDSLARDSVVKDSLLKDSLARVDSLAREDSLIKARGLVLVNAKSKSAVLGTKSSDAHVNERPAMKVKFNYDFYISRYEAMCGEFNTLIKPVTGLVLECETDSLPATNVTFYDAVLFANERSKKEGLDTAYTYLSKKLDSENHCVNLEGFVFHPEVGSFRLPTEAEWVLVANDHWDSEKAWTAENSDYRLHPICSIAQDDDICDMKGNAMEWVNDWFGLFRDTTVQNYVGAPDGGTLAQRVVKGGSFRNNASSITLHARGDVYTVTSSTKGDYVGFRLAFGNIPDAAWMGSNGRAVSSRISPLANSSSIYPYSKTYQAKLVFRNDVTGNLAFIDYSSGSLSVVEIVDTIQAYHPDISPDGSRVAFCTKYEGISGLSELYVRDLNEEGSNLVKLEVESAAIPRWRVLDNGDTVIVYVTDAGNNKTESVFRSTSTWQVPFSKGRFGIPQKLFDGAYHGGISYDNRLTVTGSRLLRAMVAPEGSTVLQSGRDTVWYNGEQACNVSLAQDGSKKTLFLDFGSATGREFVGKRYSTHQRMMIADSTGKLVQTLVAPTGYTFDHAEWAVGFSNVAVATLANVNGAHTEIVLVDAEGENILPLAKGEELWHPNLWTLDLFSNRKLNLLDLDSACVYMTESSDITTWIMKVKMDIFWQYRDSTEAVIIGSSRSFAGVDPLCIRSFFTINMAYSAEDFAGTTHFIERYIVPLIPKLKVIVLTLDYDRWYIKAENWNNWFSDIPGYEYDKHHDYWKDGLKGDMYAISKNTLGPPEDRYMMFSYNRGLYYSTTVGWGSEFPEVAINPNWYEYDKSGVEFNLLSLKRILDLTLERGIKVVGAVFPQSPYYKTQTDAWGRYGPTRGAAKEMQDSVAKLVELYPNFTLFDEYHDGEHDYSYEDFSNEDHLSLVGAQKLTGRLDMLLKELDK